VHSAPILCRLAGGATLVSGRALAVGGRRRTVRRALGGDAGAGGCARAPQTAPETQRDSGRPSALWRLPEQQPTLLAAARLEDQAQEHAARRPPPRAV